MHQSIVFCSTCTMSSYRKFTFAISSPDEFLVTSLGLGLGLEPRSLGLGLGLGRGTQSLGLSLGLGTWDHMVFVTHEA